MTDEEKKAIDDLFALTHINGYIDLHILHEVTIHTLYLSKWQKGVKVLLNLIKKQSKEIEELKEEYNTKLLSNAGIYQLGFNDGEKSIKNEIKAKIEELQEDIKYSANPLSIDNSKYGIKVLQSLLEKE